jgi:hypothetical protein
VDDRHYRGTIGASANRGAFHVALRYQHDGGDSVVLGGLPSSVLPRSAYALRVLDPALPPGTLAGEEYNGWRIESSVPSMPMTAFYQRHDLGGQQLSLAGLEIALSSDANPILKVPGLDVTLGAARVLGDPLRGETKWWIGTRWRP